MSFAQKVTQAFGLYDGNYTGAGWTEGQWSDPEVYENMTWQKKKELADRLEAKGDDDLASNNDHFSKPHDIAYIRADADLQRVLSDENATAAEILAAKAACADAIAEADKAWIDERRGLVYTARVALDGTTLRVDGRDVEVAPGMAATVEVRTGERRILDFLLDPVTRRGQESLRER